MSCNHNYKNLKVRRGEYRFFKLENPLLDEGEVSHAYKTKDGFYIVKIGDGTTRWNDLPCLVFDANIPTTTPGPCYAQQYFKLEDSPYDTSFFAFSTKNRDVEPTSINANIVGASGYAVNFTGNVSTSPQMSVDYSDRRPRLSYDNYEAVMSVYLGQLDGRQTPVGETIPLFAIGQSNLSAHEVLPSGAISYSILKTSDNNDGSISGTALLYQSDELYESGNKSIRIMPSSWFDTKFERNYYRHRATMSGVVVLDWSYALSGINIGINATTHSIIAGNALPSGVFANTEECPEVFAQLNEMQISDSGHDAGFTIYNGINSQGQSFTGYPHHVYTEETEIAVKDLDIQSVDSLVATSGTMIQVYNSNSEKVFEVNGPMVLSTYHTAELGNVHDSDFEYELYKNWSGVDPADGVAWNDKLPSGVRHNLLELSQSELEILGLDTVDAGIAEQNLGYLSYRTAGAGNTADSNYTIKIVKEKVECSDPQVSSGSGLVFDDFIFTRLCPSATTPAPEYYCVIDQTTPPPTTTQAPAGVGENPESCFFALHSMWIGQSQLYSPDYCLQETTTMTCNDTADGNSSWILTEPGSWTYAVNNDNGVLDSPEALQGYMMMVSLDSVFLPAGMSMHIFDGPDNTHTEMVRFVGPILVWDRGYPGVNVTFDQAAIHTILSNQDSSLGGKWGDYVPANRIFDQDNLPSDCFINFPSNLALSSFYSQAGTTTETSHTLELRCNVESACDYRDNIGPQRFRVFESTATGTPPSGLIFTPDGTKYKYDVVQFVGNNQSVSDPSTGNTYTNNTGKFILYDGNQIGTSFSIGDKIKLDPTYWATVFTVKPEYTYKITDIMSPGIDLTTLQNDSTFSNSQVLFLECDNATTTTTTTTTEAPATAACFVAIGSTIMGINYLSSVHTPDTCTAYGCNQPIVESTWQFTSDTNMTFNGEEPASHTTPQTTDLGSIILNSMDSIFVANESSFHIFDNNNVELARFTGPCIITRQLFKSYYTGQDVRNTLSTQSASIGGNWGDYITNSRVFFSEELPTTQGELFLNLPSNTDFHQIHTIASATHVHRFEIRTASCPTTTTSTTAAP
jgi:hypothetical protein